MSNIIKSLGIGIGSLGMAYILIGIIVAILILIILVCVLFSKWNKLHKKYIKFMKGKDAKSLEQEIIGLYEDNKFVKLEIDKNNREIHDIQKRLEYCFQKIGVVKYDAFSQMGGQLSFCIALLDSKNNGFLLNAVQSSDGCYTYTKTIRKGESEITLGKEEMKALNKAMDIK